MQKTFVKEVWDMERAALNNFGRTMVFRPERVLCVRLIDSGNQFCGEIKLPAEFEKNLKVGAPVYIYKNADGKDVAYSVRGQMFFPFEFNTSLRCARQQLDSINGLDKLRLKYALITTMLNHGEIPNWSASRNMVAISKMNRR